MSLITILIILLVLVLIGALPGWPHSKEWGYNPALAIVIILIILLVVDRF